MPYNLGVSQKKPCEEMKWDIIIPIIQIRN